MDRLVLVTVQATDRLLRDTVLVMARPVRTIAATGNVVVDGGTISPADFEHGTDASRAGLCRTVSASPTGGASRSRPCGQAFVGKLVNDIEHPISASIVGAVLDKVVGPDVIAVLRPQPDVRSVGQPEEDYLFYQRHVVHGDSIVEG